MNPWKVGFEIELLAPIGRSRADLAQALVERIGGSMRRCFHAESEPSKVPGTPIFHNLTLGFEVLDEHGALFARCVDDLTLQDDLNRSVPPVPGWYRIVSDDLRLLNLTRHVCDPEQPLEQVLLPLAHLFATEVTAGPGGMVRLADESGAPIAICAPLPGERERPCELISAPLVNNRRDSLALLLDTARTIGCTIPKEAAVHIHFDAQALCSAPVLVRLVQTLNEQRLALREQVGTNAHCRRLGPWPQELIDAVAAPDFINLTWPDAQNRLKAITPSKFCDFNLRNLILGTPTKHTLEVRILPGSMDCEQILDWTAMFEQLLLEVVNRSGSVI